MRKTKSYTEIASVESFITYVDNNKEIELELHGEVELNYVLDNLGVRDSDFYSEDSREFSITESIISEKDTIYQIVKALDIKNDITLIDMQKETDLRFLDKNGLVYDELPEEEQKRLLYILETAMEIAIEDDIDNIEEEGKYQFDDIEINDTLLDLSIAAINKETLVKQRNKIMFDFIKALGLRKSDKKVKGMLQLTNKTKIIEYLVLNYDNFQDMMNTLKENGGSELLDKYLSSRIGLDKDIETSILYVKKYQKKLKESKRNNITTGKKPE